MSSDQPSPSLHGSCHCGAVHLTLPTAPTEATSCNCSLCHRAGGIWAY
ncbi:MAG: GFA family protein [Pseudomarimonas sp.]